MRTSNLDIVYCVKDTPDNPELKYSLRSLKNIPHKNVYIYGGCPRWVNHDTVKYIPVVQNKGNKWLNPASLLKEIVDNDEISENFIWFNDDFFVLQPIEELNYSYDRTLSSRVADFYKISYFATMNRYCTRLKNTSRTLKFGGYEAKNFELHLPIIFNRKKLKSIFEKYPNMGAKRSLYGNIFVKEATERSDVKIYDNQTLPGADWDFVSTSDDSFKNGNVGKYLEKKFNKKSKYEKGGKNVS